MNDPVSAVTSPVQIRTFHASQAIGTPPEVAMTEERLPFTVRLVRNEEDLKKAVQIRQSAYARHMPDLAETLRKPEALDMEDGVVVLLAESKLDGSPLGSARIQTNQYKPLALEKDIDFPDWLKGKSLAHVSRLGIDQGEVGRLVKLMLFKGLFKYWEQHGIEWAAVAARAPLDRMYQQLLFQDVFPGQGFTPLPHMNNIPHRVMAFQVATALQRWTQAKHRLTNFIFFTHHPDLDVSIPRPDLLTPDDAVKNPTLVRLTH